MSAGRNWFSFLLLMGSVSIGFSAPATPAGVVSSPAIGFSSYFGGISSEDLPRVALAPGGGIYVAGSTSSADLPPGDDETIARRGGLAGESDAFVAKLSADGARLEFVTYLGGSGSERAGGVAVDPAGDVWVSGQTTSPDFPAANGDISGPADAFVARLDGAGGAVTWAAYIGGSGIETGTGIAVDADGNVYLTGTTDSVDFVTVAAAQSTPGGGTDAFVVGMSPSGSEPLFATYLGGSGDDSGFAVATDGAGNVHVAGSTAAPDFPTSGPVQPSFGGAADAFVVTLDDRGRVLFATTLGGSGTEAGLSISVDNGGAAYVTGQTDSPDFPTRNPFQQYLGGAADAFVIKIAPAGASVVYSTFLGGAEVDVGGGIVVDGAGNAHITGMTASPDFPTHDSLQPFFGGGSDVFVARVNDQGSALTYSTLSGGGGGEAGIGIAVDGAGNAYVVGQTGSDDFPTYNAVQPALAGAQDVFITKYCLSLVFPEEREIASGAAGDVFSVTTPAGCVWIAFSETPWLTLRSPNVVAGPGDVQFAVAPNATGAPRAGVLNVAGDRVSVVQAPATDCEYEISPGSENFFMQGGVGRINIATRADCAWTARSNVDWISLSGMDKGTGEGVVSFTVQANRTGRQRSGTISVAGHTFVVFDWIR